MKNSNVAIFIPFLGCPQKCSFCNQSDITGEKISQPTLEEVRDIIKNSVSYLKENIYDSEIAFFGGSFTAIDRDYMINLLKTACTYVEKYNFKGIRISTRPDAINDEILDILKEHKVTAIELGTQSMDDEVLKLNNRGHTVEDTINAAKKIKQYDFSLGLQMMIGLYGDTKEKSIDSAKKIAELSPDTIRIYPCIVIKGTKLEELYNKKIFKPFSIETAVNICSELIPFFEEKNIKIIRVGLHSEQDLVNNIIVGPYHPAFKELCENEIYYKIILEKIKIKINDDENNNCLKIFVKQSEISKAIGQHKINLKRLNDLGYNIKFCIDNNLKKYQIKIAIIKGENSKCF